MLKKILKNKRLALGAAVLATFLAVAPTMACEAASSAYAQSERPEPPNWDGNGQPPAPPTDENGNPLPPPNRNGNEGSGNRHDPPNGSDHGQPPAPPTDENGNPLPPPDWNGDNGNRPAPPDGSGHGQPPQGGPAGRGQDAQNADSLSASCVADKETATMEGKSLSAAGPDVSVVLARNGAALALQNMALHKSGDTTSEEGSNFTGQNAILLANNSHVEISDSTLSSDAEGANAIFATGKNASIAARHVVIRTSGNSSRGLDATYGGTVKADDVEIETQGAHCAALATDRGEGTIAVTNGKLITRGEGSPCIYSTGNISVADSVGESFGSEIAVVEGKNSIDIQRANLTGHQRNGVMLYQSFSGDADVGVARFAAKDSKLTNLSGGAMFYVTNTKAEITLDNVSISTPGSAPLLRAASGRWGRDGKNGGDATLTATRQKLAGDVEADALSRVSLLLNEASDWTGTFDAAGTAQESSLHLAKGAHWSLTADSYVGSFSDELGDFSNIDSNGFSVYYDAEQSPSLQGRTYNIPGGGQIVPCK